MSKLPKYRAAIIGCGQIGVLYSKPHLWSGVLTHAHAYQHEKRTELVAVVDVDPKKAKHAARLWKTKAYSNLSRMLDNEKVDILSVCVPDQAHEAVLEACLDYNLKAVFCEKPLTTDTVSAQRIISRYTQSRILLGVNFSRRWNPRIRRLSQEIKAGKYGQWINAWGVYTKGILHNGSHMVDLMRFLIGEISSVKALSGKADWKAADPAVDAYLHFKDNKTAFLLAGDERRFSIFELEMLFSKARVSLKDFCEDLTIEKVIADPALKGYKVLKSAGSQKTDLSQNILLAIGNLVDALEGKGRLLCPGTDALKTQAVCQRVLNDYKNNFLAP